MLQRGRPSSSSSLPPTLVEALAHASREVVGVVEVGMEMMGVGEAAAGHLQGGPLAVGRLLVGPHRGHLLTPNPSRSVAGRLRGSTYPLACMRSTLLRVSMAMAGPGCMQAASPA